MDSGTAQWMLQDFGGTKSNILQDNTAAQSSCTRPPTMERKVRPQKDQVINCPRCHSTNTKFCYYNNYSLTQPRYFCKTCRRYWTEGGTLRNVPVGGGSRKNTKKFSSNSHPLLSTVTTTQVSSHKLYDHNDLNRPNISHEFYPHQENPKIHHDQGQDLNLCFQAGPQDYQHGIPQFLDFPKIQSGSDNNVLMMNSSSSANASSSCTTTQLSALNFLRVNGINADRGLNSFFPMAPSDLETNTLFTSGFPFQECKPSLVPFTRDVNKNGTPHEDVVNGSLMFTLGATKRHSSAGGSEQDKGQENSNGVWNGMLGGGHW